MNRERRRAELTALSLSICAGIGLNLGGGDTSAVLRPFYTSREWDEMNRARAEGAQMAAQAAQIAKLRRLSRQ